MEKLKKKRAPERTAITKNVNTLELELSKKPLSQPLLQATLNVLECHWRRLQEFDEQIKDLMVQDDSVSEEVYITECEGIDGYMSSVALIKVKVEKLLFPEQAPIAEGSLNESIRSRHKAIKYPKVEMREFSGDLKDWLGWWAFFEKVNKDEDLDDDQKFTYLQQCMKKGTKAGELVNGYSQVKDGYEAAIQALIGRYGKKELLQQLYIREVIGMMMKRTNECAVLSVLYDRLTLHLRSLEALGIPTDQIGTWLLPMVETCLPDDILLAWQRSANFGTDGSTFNPPKRQLDFLMEFLRAEVDHEEHRKLAKSGFGAEDKRNQGRKKFFEECDLPTAAGLFSGATKLQCYFCGKSHESRNCFSAKKMSLAEKKKKLLKRGPCFNCLKGNHMSKNCTENICCHGCKERHHFLMCPGNPKNQPNESRPEVVQVPSTQTNLNCMKEVLLNTLMVRVENPKDGRNKKIRVVLDSGSQRSYVLKMTAIELGLTPTQKLTMNHELFGGTEVRGTHHSVFDLRMSSLDGKFRIEVDVMDEVAICNSLPRAPKGKWIEDMKSAGILVNDLERSNPTNIEFLIGADILGRILTGKMKKFDNGLFATETGFGWSVMGEIDKERDSTVAMTSICQSIKSSCVTDLWSLDIIGIKDPTDSLSQAEKDLHAQNHFKKTVIQLDSGRYSVSLPWISGQISLPQNREVAFQRLESTTRKLVAQGMVQGYTKVFSAWKAEGIIAEVTSESDMCHYLPHRAVLKPESTTTPIRPVFDASCKVGRFPSLNGCLEKGPNLIELIPPLLYRFRMGRYSALGDIRKAFQMVEMNEEDRDYQRFLWWKDVEKKVLAVYRHNRVVFGINASPFLLAAVVNHQLDKMESQYLKTVPVLRNSLYVDNCVLSLSSIEEYEEFRKEATEIMNKAGMELRQWERTGDDEERMTKVLGLKWSKVEDVLMIDSISSQLPGKITKRLMLSMVHQVFDPLGFLAPVVIIPKILIQKAWAENRKWDEQVSVAVQNEFAQWHEGLTNCIGSFRFPRRCTTGDPTQNNFQFHVFSDASGSAYAAVVYLRTEIDGKVEVQLIEAKSRVAPVKKVTIPRLELLGCSIAARLASSVKIGLSLVHVPTWYWTDSSTALAWIKHNDEWGTFVGNRVKEILKLSGSHDWNFVPGLLNPADLPSRGIQPGKFLEKRWWEGPAWLKNGKEKWPQQEFRSDPDTVNSERRKGVMTTLLCPTVRPWYTFTEFHHRNVRIMAYILRFVHAVKKIRRESEIKLKNEEQETAEQQLFLQVQRESFPEANDVIGGLSVVRDRVGLIRVNTKLTNRQDSIPFKTPVLLPKDHLTVTQLIRDLHQFNCHGGAQFLMSLLREKVWIMKGRLAVSKVIRACLVCQRYSQKKSHAPTTALPEARIMKEATAFQISGVDLAGYLTLKDNSKVWIVLFTCAVFRAVHLELVKETSTEDFILAFTRFCMRRRRPEIIYSDRGTNFIGADNLFAKIDWEVVKRKTKQYRIDWRFNPPAAPWWGGFYERLVKSMKNQLRRMCGFAKLTYQGLETCVCQVEWVLNHRPLTFVTEDGEDLVPLTPAMFLGDLPFTEMPEIETLTGSVLSTGHKTLSVLLGELRDRFRIEYLGLLVHRGSLDKETKLQVGDYVLIGSDDTKRLLWPMGRIVEVIPGKDGVIRVARVKTKNGDLFRPVQRLYRLELPNDDPAFRTRVVSAFRSERDMNRDSVQAKDKKAKKPRDDEETSTRSGRIVKKPLKFCDY